MFTEHLQRAVAYKNRRPDSALAVFFLDLDRFKTTNDTIGHFLADQVLVTVARRLEQCIRLEDVAARFGGDEFAILLPDFGAAAEAVIIADRILAALRVPFEIDGTRLSISASIGVAIASDKGSGRTSADSLLKEADVAMYEAKSRGRAQYVVFDETIRARALADMKLEYDLRQAVEHGELRIVYQPIVLIDTRKIVGFEALVRWQHPQRGLLLPAEFLAKAEESDIIIAIDRWVLFEATRQLGAWQREFGTNHLLTMNVNLSAKEFRRPDLVDDLREILATTILPPRSLTVEITESATVGTSDGIIAILNEIRELGIEVNIDDFGTGYSALVYLSHLPIDTLKIDQSLVSSMATNGKNVEVLRAIITLGGSLGIKCIAEGVETEPQAAALAALGCTTAQGFLFSRPVATDAARALLSQFSEKV